MDPVTNQNQTPAGDVPVISDKIKDGMAAAAAAMSGLTPSDDGNLIMPATGGTEPITERLEKARVAMEGPERAAERLQREHEQKIEQERKNLEAQKTAIEKEKEKMEIVWIDLDEKRNSFKRDLEPILVEETKLEDEEKIAELEEEKATMPEEKKAAEKKRQDLQTRRKASEEKKWIIQDKIEQVEKIITQNTEHYQELLSKEEILIQKINDLESGVA